MTSLRSRETSKDFLESFKYSQVKSVWAGVAKIFIHVHDKNIPFRSILAHKLKCYNVIQYCFVSRADKTKEKY